MIPTQLLWSSNSYRKCILEPILQCDRKKLNWLIVHLVLYLLYFKTVPWHECMLSIYIYTIIWQIQLVWFLDFCVHRSSFAESDHFGCGGIDWIDREGWRWSCHVQKSCPLLPLVAFSLPFSCPPHLHTSPKSATTRWWSTPARRNASLRRLSRAILSPSSIR